MTVADIGALLKDKRVLLVAGAGAVAGAAVFLTKKQAGGGSSSAGTVTTGALGSYDSSATDAYNNFSNILDQYGQSITAIQDQLAGGKVPPTTTTPGGTTTNPTNPASAGKTPTTGYYRIKAGDTLSSIGKRYGKTPQQLKSMNPTIIKNINSIKAGTTIRVTGK